MPVIEVNSTDLMQTAIDQLLEDLNRQVDLYFESPSHEDKDEYRRQARASYLAIHAIEAIGWGVDVGDADKKWLSRFTKVVGSKWLKKLWPWEEPKR